MIETMKVIPAYATSEVKREQEGSDVMDSEMMSEAMGEKSWHDG